MAEERLRQVVNLKERNWKNGIRAYDVILETYFAYKGLE